MAKRLTKSEQEENRAKNIELFKREYGLPPLGIMSLGMDISLNGPAFSIVSNRIKKHFFIDNKAGGKRFPKIRKIKLLLKKIINDYDVNFVVRESYSLSSKFQRETLAEIHGVLMYELFRIEMPVLSIAPIQMKKYICGDARGDKVLLSSTLTEEYNLGALPNSNVGDAYGLSIMGYELFQYMCTPKNSIKNIKGKNVEKRLKKLKHTKAVFESILMKKDLSQDMILW